MALLQNFTRHMCRRIIISERVSALLTPGRTRAERPASFSRRARRASQALPRARSETKRSEGRAKRKLGSGEQGKSGRRRSRLPRDPRHVTRGYTFPLKSDILPVYIRVCRYLKKFDIWKKVELLKMFFFEKGKMHFVEPDKQGNGLYVNRNCGYVGIYAFYEGRKNGWKTGG